MDSWCEFIGCISVDLLLFIKRGQSPARPKWPLGAPYWVLCCRASRVRFHITLGVSKSWGNVWAHFVVQALALGWQKTMLRNSLNSLLAWLGLSILIQAGDMETWETSQWDVSLLAAAHTIWNWIVSLSSNSVYSGVLPMASFYTQHTNEMGCWQKKVEKWQFEEDLCLRDVTV